MAPLVCAPLNVDLGPYSGVELLCTHAAMALWGIACMQTFLYFWNYSEDNWALKCVVGWLWLIDTVHSCLLASGSYKANITGQVFSTDSVREEYVIQMFITALVSVPAQCFFAYRIWKLSQQKWLLYVVAPFVTWEFIDGILLLAYNVAARTATESSLSTARSRGFLIASFATSATVDIFLSSGLCLALWFHYMRGGIALRRTTSMVYRVTLFTIATGSWTALVALLTIMSVVLYPKNFVYVGLYFLLSPMYCNSVLANLNARTYLRGDPNEPLGLSGVRVSLTVPPPAVPSIRQLPGSQHYLPSRPASIINAHRERDDILPMRGHAHPGSHNPNHNYNYNRNHSYNYNYNHNHRHGGGGGGDDNDDAHSQIGTGGQISTGTTTLTKRLSGHSHHTNETGTHLSEMKDDHSEGFGRPGLGLEMDQGGVVGGIGCIGGIGGIVGDAVLAQSEGQHQHQHQYQLKQENSRYGYRDPRRGAGGVDDDGKMDIRAMLLQSVGRGG